MSDKKTIVLADDDADLVSLLTERCTRRGYSVFGVDNALDAINVIHRVVPDLVCIDVNMPAGNGLSVCEMMSEDKRLRTIPVVVLTGNASEQTIRRCHDMMIYYVEKNVDVWSRIEPLFAELLGAPTLQPPASPVREKPANEPPAPKPEKPDSKPPASPQPDKPASEPPGSPRRDKPAGSPKPAGSLAADQRQLAQKLEIPASTRKDKAVPALKPAEVPSLDPPSKYGTTAIDLASDFLLDAVFTMLGSETEEPQDTATSDASDAAFAPPPAKDEPPWVLSIDDDSDFSDALKCRLETYGVAVVRAFTGMDGYRMAFTSPASAILLDYNMPNGQGDYILGRLSDNPVTKDIPVIVITGVRDKTLERKMYALGAKKYLTKPVQFEVLRDELAKYIDMLTVPA